MKPSELRRTPAPPVDPGPPRRCLSRPLADLDVAPQHAPSVLLEPGNGEVLGPRTTSLPESPHVETLGERAYQPLICARRLGGDADLEQWLTGNHDRDGNQPRFVVREEIERGLLALEDALVVMKERRGVE